MAIQKIKTSKYMIEIDNETTPVNTLRVINLEDLTSYEGAYTSEDFNFKTEQLRIEYEKAKSLKEQKEQEYIAAGGTIG